MLEPDDLNRLLFQTEQTRRLILGEALEAHGLTYAQWSVIDGLAREGVSAMTNLAQAICADRTTLTRVVDGLVAAGWVERETKPSDRRSVLVQLTRSGERLAARVSRGLMPLQVAMFARCDADELATLARTLARTLAQLRQIQSAPRAKPALKPGETRRAI
jgi:DNA-binding MarR family transcriptional regulator